MITVKNREAAWAEANRIFPTDYEQDTISTERAGYPIYRSTAEDDFSWISDLGCTLEVNVINKKTRVVDTTRINIEVEPEIKQTDLWYSSEIREMCIANDFYNSGNIKEYSDLLEFVEKHEPTAINIYKVAKNILEHTSDQEQTIENIMFMIRRDVVRTCYELS